MKGFIVLGQTPGALQPSESLIAKVRGLLATGAKGVGSEAAKVLVSQAFTAAAAAFPVVATILHKT